MHLILSIIFLISGAAALYFGARWLVRGSVSLALVMGIRPVIIGLTIVAFGTSSPELLVSLNAGRTGNADIALGNVIGSNIANIALILGVSAIIRPIVMNIRAVRFDIIFMLLVSAALSFLVLDNDLDRINGALFLIGITCYIAIKIYQAMKNIREGKTVDAGLEVSERLGHDAAPDSRGVSAGLIAAGTVILIAGSELFVRGAVSIAELLGVSNIVIGLTVVAFGTSLPELATSVVASARGEGDVSLGNVVGSNIFNILFILGATALFFPIGTSDVHAADLVVMIGLSLLVIPISLIRGRITRPVALFLLVSYCCYVYYLYARQPGTM
ncbi:MAG: calcium/sodium antiporter [Spirochaetes bacterium]|nr:calcium/sodium antiporter [Spirochaetota bacterium]